MDARVSPMHILEIQAARTTQATPNNELGAHSIPQYLNIFGCWRLLMLLLLLWLALDAPSSCGSIFALFGCWWWFATNAQLWRVFFFVVECCSTGLYQFEFISKAHKLFQCNVVASTVCKYHTRTHTNALGNRQNAKNPKCFVQIIQKCMSLIHSLTNKVP